MLKTARLEKFESTLKLYVYWLNYSYTNICIYVYINIVLQSSPDLCRITRKNKNNLLVYNHRHTRINTHKYSFLSNFLYFVWAYFFTLVLASKIQRDMVTLLVKHAKQ